MPPEGSLSGSIAADGASRGSDLFRPDYQRLCTALLAAGRGIEAVEMLRGAVADHPNDPALRNRLAVLLKREGRLADAIPVLRDGIARFPDNARAHSELLDILHRLGRHAEAVPVAMSAQRARPLDFELQSRITAAMAHRPASGTAAPVPHGPQGGLADATLDLVAPDMLGALLHGGQAKPAPATSRRGIYVAMGAAGIAAVVLALAFRHPAPVQVASFTPVQAPRPATQAAAAPSPVRVTGTQPLGPPMQLAAAPPPATNLVVPAPGPLAVEAAAIPEPVHTTGTLPIGPLLRLASVPPPAAKLMVRAPGPLVVEVAALPEPVRITGTLPIGPLLRLAAVAPPALPRMVPAPLPLVVPPVEVASLADTAGRATAWTPEISAAAPLAIRIVYPRGGEAAAAALAASLRDTAPATLEQAGPGRSEPGIRYFFAQDAVSASALQRRLGPGAGQVSWSREASLPSPGVLELILRGTAARK